MLLIITMFSVGRTIYWRQIVIALKQHRGLNAMLQDTGCRRTLCALRPPCSIQSQWCNPVDASLPLCNELNYILWFSSYFARQSLSHKRMLQKVSGEMQKKLKAHDRSREANKYFSKKSQNSLTGSWITLLKQRSAGIQREIFCKFPE